MDVTEVWQSVVETYIHYSGSWDCKLACGHWVVVYGDSAPPSMRKCQACSDELRKRLLSTTG